MSSYCHNKTSHKDCARILIQCAMRQLKRTKAEQSIKQTPAEVEQGKYCVMKVDQLVSHTFLWAGHHRLSSSVRWELGHRGPHT